MIATILLIPNDGDPLGLLADGVCGAKPPTLDRFSMPTGPKWTNDPIPSLVGPGTFFGIQRDTTALVLAHAGQAVPEGMARFWRVNGYARRWRHPDQNPDGKLPSRMYLEDAWHAAEFGRLVFLDEYGAEIEPTARPSAEEEERC